MKCAEGQKQPTAYVSYMFYVQCPKQFSFGINKVTEGHQMMTFVRIIPPLCFSSVDFMRKNKQNWTKDHGSLRLRVSVGIINHLCNRNLEVYTTKH